MMPLFMPGPLPKLLPALPPVAVPQEKVTEWFPMSCRPCRHGYYRLRRDDGSTERLYYDPVMNLWTVVHSNEIASAESPDEMPALGYEAWQGLLK